MNTFSRVAVVMIGMTGLAAAQPKPDAKTDAKAPPADAKGGMAEMKPPPELAELAKAVSGTWRCTGQAADATMKMVNMTATLRNKIDLDSWWVHGSFEARMGKEPFKFESFTTYDPESKKWKRVMVESGSMWSNGESAGLKDNKVEWTMTSHSSRGDAMFRDHEDVSDPKAGVKMSGELSMDGGKTWMPVYTMACKK
jgi:hypothetical protein